MQGRRVLSTEGLPEPVSVHIPLHLLLGRIVIRKDDDSKKRGTLVCHAIEYFPAYYVLEDGGFEWILLKRWIAKTRNGTSFRHPLQKAVLKGWKC